MHQIATYLATAIERSARVLIVVLAVLLVLGIAIARADEPAFDVFNTPPSFDVFEQGPPVSFDVFPSGADPAPKTRRVVWVYHNKRVPCPVCKSLAAAEKEMPEFDFKWAPIPRWVSDKYDAQPVLHWNTSRGHGCVYEGWPGVERFLEIDRDYVPVEERPAVARRSALLYGPAHGRWTWPGDLRKHLQSPPHNVSAATVASWSDAQCIAYHDRAHEGRAQAVPQNCPNGICPTVRQRAFRLMSREENRSRHGAVRVARQLAVEFPAITFWVLLRLVLSILLMLV